MHGCRRTVSPGVFVSAVESVGDVSEMATLLVDQQAALQAPAAEVLFPDDLLPGVGSDPLTLR